MPVKSADPAQPAIRWRRSSSLGLPSAGRLVAGVQLPARGRHFFTWDPVLRRSPNRPWRRFGSDRLLRAMLEVLDGYAAAHPSASRVGIGDLSRPRGGEFGRRFGWVGHASHQNGLDLDVYYPRRDGRERAVTTPSQIHRRLSQELLDRFLRAGAERIFVGPNTGLEGPAEVVQVLPRYHDNHMHVRLSADPAVRRVIFGHSSRGRDLTAVEIAGHSPKRESVLVVGCIHGDECAGRAVTRLLGSIRRKVRSDLWLVHDLNPDGRVLGRRQNARGVDLNRNFPVEWRANGVRGDRYFPGPRPLSEPETRSITELVLRIRPEVTIWFHQPQGLVRAWGESIPSARRYARLADETFRALGSPPGSATNWQNRRFPDTSSFVVELASGHLSPNGARRHALAILTLAR